MKYISTDSTHPLLSSRNGYWLKDNAVYDVSHDTHINFIITHADWFGLTDQTILDIYARYDEAPGKEAKAREELVRIAAVKGWIRIRHYSDRRDYWSIQTDDTEARKTSIVEFINWAVANKIMQPDAEAVILGFNNKEDRKEYKWKDGGIQRYLLENEQSGKT